MPTIKLRSTQDLPTRDMRRLMQALSQGADRYPLEQFSIAADCNVAVLKLAPILDTEEMIVQHVLTAATVQLFAMSVEDDHRGWCFVLPHSGNLVSTVSGIIYTRPDLARLKEEFAKRVRSIEGEIKALDPEVYLPHNDFSICGVDDGAVLLIARNNTTVVTQ